MSRPCEGWPPPPARRIVKIAQERAIEKMRNLIASYPDVGPRMASQRTGSFFVLTGTTKREFRADRSLMETVQLSETEVAELIPAATQVAWNSLDLRSAWPVRILAPLLRALCKGTTALLSFAAVRRSRINAIDSCFLIMWCLRSHRDL